MVSNFGYGRQQVPCYLLEFMAFKCYFNTWMKLYAEYWFQSHWEVTLSQNSEALFIQFLNLWQREEPLIHVLHDQPSELVRTIMMRFLKQSVVGENSGKFLLSLDVNNTDNKRKHDREIEIGESSSKTLKKLRQGQKKEP